MHKLCLNTQDFFNIEYAFSLPGPIKPLSTKTVTGHTGFNRLMGLYCCPLASWENFTHAFFLLFAFITDKIWRGTIREERIANPREATLCRTPIH